MRLGASAIGVLVVGLLVLIFASDPSVGASNYETSTPQYQPSTEKQSEATVLAVWRQMRLAQVECYSRFENNAFGDGGSEDSNAYIEAHRAIAPYEIRQCGEPMALMPRFGRSPGMDKLLVEGRSSNEPTHCSFDVASGIRDLGTLPARICVAYVAASDDLSNRGDAGIVDCTRDLMTAISDRVSADTACHRMLKEIFPFWSP